MLGTCFTVNIALCLCCLVQGQLQVSRDERMARELAAQLEQEDHAQEEQRRKEEAASARSGPRSGRVCVFDAYACCWHARR